MNRRRAALLPSSERSTTQASASLAIMRPSAGPISAVIGTSACFPPNTTTGSGEVKATLDSATSQFSYTVTYAGLSGPAVAAHFHGPAGPGVNAPPVIPVTPLESPMKGAATLTAPQRADLTSGKWYFNVHTAAHPGGEIRGQLAEAR